MSLDKSTSEEEKIRNLKLDGRSALRWAADGKVEAWVHKFLCSGLGGETNQPFSDSLKREQRWWNGPLEVKLEELLPAVGTSPDSEYVVTEDYWVARTTQMAPTFTEPLALPPLIIEYREGGLSVRDGNTRLETMKRLGWPTCWIIIWYNSEHDYLTHTKALESSSKSN